MAKILVSIEDTLLKRIDAAARRLGLSRSAYLSRLAERAFGVARGPGAHPEVRRTLRSIQDLFARQPTPGDPTAIIRRLRDARGEELGRRARRR